eukprot:scaffold11181_cov54-Cyclotella_meneghiniana.AAC.4
MIDVPSSVVTVLSTFIITSSLLLRGNGRRHYFRCEAMAVVTTFESEAKAVVTTFESKEWPSSLLLRARQWPSSLLHYFRCEAMAVVTASLLSVRGNGRRHCF